MFVCFPYTCYSIQSLSIHQVLGSTGAYIPIALVLKNRQDFVVVNDLLPPKQFIADSFPFD